MTTKEDKAIIKKLERDNLINDVIEKCRTLFADKRVELLVYGAVGVILLSWLYSVLSTIWKNPK